MPHPFHRRFKASSLFSSSLYFFDTLFIPIGIVAVLQLWYCQSWKNSPIFFKARFNNTFEKWSSTPHKKTIESIQNSISSYRYVFLKIRINKNFQNLKQIAYLEIKLNHFVSIFEFMEGGYNYYLQKRKKIYAKRKLHKIFLEGFKVS